jgi:hypothetical protein
MQIVSYPAFTHPRIQILYTEDLFIDEDILRDILSLPRESLIDDLHLLLYDSINRFDYYQQETGSVMYEECQVLHALFLLAELKSERSGPVLLDVLRQSEEYLYFWLDDFLTVDIWEMIYLFFYGQFETLNQFVREREVYTYAHTEVSVAVMQMALHNPAMKASAVAWYKSVFEYFIECNEKGIDIGADLCGLYIGDALSLRDKSLEPLIEEMYKREMPDPTIVGEWEIANEAMAKLAAEADTRDLTTDIYTRYDDFQTEFAEMMDDSDNDDFFLNDEADDEDYFPEPQEPYIRTEPKVGRNDPCPCGSGKKFKKCHGVEA